MPCENAQLLLQIVLSSRSKGHIPCSVPYLFMPPPAESPPPIRSSDPSYLEPTALADAACVSRSVCFTFACAMNGSHNDSVGLIQIDYVPTSLVATSVTGCVIVVTRPGEPTCSVVDARCYKECDFRHIPCSVLPFQPNYRLGHPEN